MAGLSFDEAVSTLLLRQQSDSLLKRHMISIRDRYNGDWVIPMTEVPDEPEVEPPIPALIAQAIDSTAMRAASTRPQIFVPALRPTISKSQRAADSRRRAYYSIWHESKLPIKVRRAVRHLVGYGTNCMGVMPYFDPKMDFSKDGPRIEVRDPLTAYPDDSAPEEIRNPINIGFIYPRSPDWILTYYPEAREYMYGYHSDLWDVFEWIDEDNIYMGILGPRMSWGEVSWNTRGFGTTHGPLQLRQWVNQAGMVPYVCPGRVTLDRIAGQITKMVGVVDIYAKLMALEAVAAERGVFADRYILARENGEITLVGGDTWKDGRTGEVNLVQGAQAVGELGNQLNPLTFNVADRLERAIRMSTGNPGVFGGEMNGSIRSGQTVSQLGAYSIDPQVQEVQEIMEYQLSALNEGVHAVFKGYWGSKKFSMYSGWPTDRGFVEFVPNEVMEHSANTVAYGMTGMDISQLSVALGQAMQMKLIDRKTAQRKHPLVDNPEEAEQAVIEEALTDATLASFLARAQQGTLAEIDIMNTLKHYRESGDFIDAVQKAQDDAQKRQATQAPPPGPGEAVPPGTMPGLSPSGTAGVEQQQPPAGPGGGAAGAAQLLQALTSQGGAGAPVPAGELGRLR